MCARVLRVQLDDTDAAPEPIPVMGRNRLPCTIAVVSDGSAVTHRGPAGVVGPVGPVLRHWAALIHECTGLAARPVYVAAQNAEDLSAGLRGLPAGIGAVVLIHTDPVHHPAVTGSERGGDGERRC